MLSHQVLCFFRFMSLIDSLLHELPLPGSILLSLLTQHPQEQAELFSSLLPLQNREAQRSSHPRKHQGHQFPFLYPALMGEEFICPKCSPSQKLLPLQICQQSSWSDLSFTCFSEASSVVQIICYWFCYSLILVSRLEGTKTSG